MRSARSKGKKDPDYLNWIRSLPCVVCFFHTHALRGILYTAHRESVFARCLRYEGQQFWSEAAHVGLRGLSQKCPDRQAIPLCTTHHTQGKDAHHVLGKLFWGHHNIDRDALVAELNKQYEQLQQRRTA